MPWPLKEQDWNKSFVSITTVVWTGFFSLHECMIGRQGNRKRVAKNMDVNSYPLLNNCLSEFQLFCDQSFPVDDIQAGNFFGVGVSKPKSVALSGPGAPFFSSSLFVHFQDTNGLVVHVESSPTRDSNCTTQLVIAKFLRKRWSGE